MATFNSPAFNSDEANAQFVRTVAKFRKTVDANTLAALVALLKEGRNTVGWKSAGRALIEGV